MIELISVYDIDQRHDILGDVKANEPVPVV